MTKVHEDPPGDDSKVSVQLVIVIGTPLTNALTQAKAARKKSKKKASRRSLPDDEVPMFPNLM